MEKYIGVRAKVNDHIVKFFFFIKCLEIITALESLFLLNFFAFTMFFLEQQPILCKPFYIGNVKTFIFSSLTQKHKE